MKKINTYLLFLFACFSVFTGKSQHKHIALINGIAHIGNGEIIENSIIAINNGTFEMVGSFKGIRLNPAAYDTVIYIEGKHIYPGLINTNNILGLHDAEAVRATRDFSETGNMNAHIRALIAYNTDNLIVPTIKTNGILYTQCTPRGGMISGSSSIMALEGWNWEDAVLKAYDGIHINFPKLSEQKFENDNDISTTANKKYLEEMQTLNKFFVDAKAYCSAIQSTEKNIRFEAMRKVLEGTANLYIHADKAKDLLSVIHFVSQHAIKKPVIVGGKESYKVSAEIKRNNIPVMLNRVHDLPDRSDENIDQVYKLPYLLQQAGILFCLQLEGDMEAMQSRNLPFNAGTAVAYGLSKEDALASITLNAAKICGIDRMIGSLEEGKLASIVVSEGDILDIKTNQIVLAYIAGKKVNLNNKQTELYQRYKTKYGLK